MFALFSNTPSVTTSSDPSDPAIQTLAKRLSKAERPLILAGFEAARSNAGSSILHLAEAIGAPVLTTYKGKGVVPETHPLSLGGAGLSPLADAVMLGLIRRSDLILMIGYDPIEMRVGWRNPFGPAQKVIEVAPLADAVWYGNSVPCSIKALV